MLQNLLRFLRSVRLTIVLLTGLVILLGLDALPGGGLELIGSPLFWLLLTMLALNTIACTGTALWRRPPTRLLNWGPHLIHIGLLFLLAGLSLSLLLRHEESVILEPGQSERLRAGIILQLVESREVHNERGDLINWQSQLRVRVPGEESWVGTTAVNQPLRIPPYHLYQTDFETRPAVRLQPQQAGDAAATPDAAHAEEPSAGVVLAVNEGFREGDILWLLAREPEATSAAGFRLQDFFFLGYRNDTLTGRQSLREGAARLGMAPRDISEKTLSGLRLVYDPGALPAGLGALLLAIGVTLYGIHYYRRRLL